MLVLSRELDEKIVIDGVIRVTVVGIRGNHVRIGIEAPEHVSISRDELCLPVEVEVAAATSGDRMGSPVTGDRTGMRIRRIESRLGDQASPMSRGERSLARDQVSS